MSLKPKLPLFLAIDQGGHASRALVFDAKGTVVSEGHCTVQTDRPQTGRVEHNAEALIESVRQAILEAVSPLGDAGRARLTAAGLATQRSTVVCWHPDTKEALSKIISWQDRRAAAWMVGFQKDAADIRERTGLYPSPHYGVGKFRWCLDHLPEVRAALKPGKLVMGPLASFLTARLTGEGKARVDPANASRTLLWNIKTKDWDPHLLKRFGVPKAVLPVSVPSRHVFGTIALGRQRLPLSVVTGDQSAALFQHGIPESGTAYVNIGTGAFIQRIHPSPIQKNHRLLSSIVFSDARHAVVALEGTVNGAGAAVTKFSDDYRIDDVFARADHWLDKAKEPPIFLNAVGGLGSPFWVPHLNSRFIGEGGVPECFTAVVESILFLIQTNLEEMHQIAGPVNTIEISGGLARLGGLCQRLADLSGLCVLRHAEHEATARGLAFLLLENNTGHWPSPPASARFLSHQNTGLQKRYQAWRRIMAKALDALQST
ncbi:MAG: FGGY family carbohydrate kinase [Nitrospiria bacterium]